VPAGVGEPGARPARVLWVLAAAVVRGAAAHPGAARAQGATGRGHGLRLSAALPCRLHKPQHLWRRGRMLWPRSRRAVPRPTTICALLRQCTHTSECPVADIESLHVALSGARPRAQSLKAALAKARDENGDLTEVPVRRTPCVRRTRCVRRPVRRQPHLCSCVRSDP